jgi:uncharacterized membrane protein
MLADSGEGWLGRAGVGLLVVGFILLYRYAVERGWLTPELRIALGLLVGAALIGGGVFFFAGRRRYRQILTGGGIVILFITGLAAAELYHLISGTVALVFFAGVAGLAFTIAARQRESIIASIGAIGALLPPSFLLEGSVPSPLLWAYLTVIMIWTGVLLSLRGWERSMVVAAVVSVLATMHDLPAVPAASATAVLALTAAWLCYGALPLLRVRLMAAHGVEALSAELLLTVPVLVTLGLAFSGAAFVFPGSSAFELTAALGAIGFAAIAFWLRPARDGEAAPTLVQFRGEAYRIDAYRAAVGACVLLLAAASMGAIDDPWHFVAVAALAGAAAVSGKWIDVELLRPLAHGLYALLGVAFVMLVERYSTLPAFDHYAVAFAVVGGLAAVTALKLERSDERLVYFIGVYLVAHVLLATELVAVQSAPWLASAAYGAVGSVLLLAGLARRAVMVQRAGMLSLALLFARLFLYDLAKVDVGVRVILFMAFGVVFLGLSYLVRSRRFVA